MSVKHAAHPPLAVANSTREQARARNSRLRERFPARPAQECWPETTHTVADTTLRLTSAPFVPDSTGARACRRRGVVKLLRWLASRPGDTWQQRWLSPAASKTIPARPGCSCRFNGFTNAASPALAMEKT